MHITVSLYVCVARKGTCETRSLHNVSEFSAYRGDTASSNSFVASNDPLRRTVAFLGPGPRHDDVTDDVTVLYVGSVFSGNTEEEY